MKYRIDFSMEDKDGAWWDEHIEIEAANDAAAERFAEEQVHDDSVKTQINIWDVEADELVRDLDIGGIFGSSGSIYRDQCEFCTIDTEDRRADEPCALSPTTHHSFNFAFGYVEPEKEPKS